MKPASLFAIGACGGALAAFLFIALDTARSVSSPEDSTSAAAFAPTEQTRAVLDAADERAGDAPEDALGDVLALESAVLRANAAARVARVWARQDPAAALAAAERVPPEWRAAYLAAAASEWAFVDPTGFFAYAEAANSIDELVAGLDLLIATDPERVFEIVARFGTAASDEIQALYLHAIRGMASRDPAGTIARLQSVATGERRDPILASIAEAYAAIDAEAAFAWATSVVPPSTDAIGKVVQAVASRDLLQAYEMLQRTPDNVGRASNLEGQMVEAALASGQSPAALADAFAVRSGPDAALFLSRVMQHWVDRDPRSAVGWMAANETYLTDELTNAIVFNLAFEDVGLAAELAPRVPPSAQGRWLDSVANRYGQFDVETGMQWLAGYEGRADYDALLGSLLRGAARGSPDFVANYIETSGGFFDRSLVQQTAFAYVEQNPQAALQWASRLDDPEYSDWALEGAIDRWTQRDGPAASDWVLSQPRNAARDRLLDTILLTSVVNPVVDAEALFRAYDSDATAQRTLAEFIFRSTRLPSSMRAAALPRAEAMLEYLTDPVFRQQAEDQIEAAK